MIYQDEFDELEAKRQEDAHQLFMECFVPDGFGGWQSTPDYHDRSEENYRSYLKARNEIWQQIDKDKIEQRERERAQRRVSFLKHLKPIR